MVRADGGDGGAEFVGQVREHSATGVFDAVEPGGHGVEGCAERFEFGAGSDRRDACGVVPEGQFAGRVGDLLEGAAQSAGEEPGDGACGEQRDEQTDPNGDEG